MTPGALAAHVKDAGRRLGFDLVAIGPADPPDHAAAFEGWLDAGHAGTMDYLERGREKRVDPERVLSGARSVVACALSYFQGPSAGGPDGVARYAWGEDYHAVMEPRLRALGQPDAVVAHLCMSDASVARAGAGLRPGDLLAFAAFHTDQWREAGRVSRFAYASDRARAVLGAAGFRVERLEVEQEVARFGSAAEALAETAGLRPRWETDGRWAAWERFVAAGGRTLTQSRLIVLARRGDRLGSP